MKLNRKDFDEFGAHKGQYFWIKNAERFRENPAGKISELQNVEAPDDYVFKQKMRKKNAVASKAA